MASLLLRLNRARLVGGGVFSRGISQMIGATSPPAFPWQQPLLLPSLGKRRVLTPTKSLVEFHLPELMKSIPVTLPTVTTTTTNEVTLPTVNTPPVYNCSKGRPGLVVIRRLKMNKHKLKKRRRKLKYLILKIVMRRETRKEKDFLNELMTKIKSAHIFEARAHVESVIRRAKLEPGREFWWKGNRLPEYLVKEKLKEEEERERRDYLSVLDKREGES